MSSFVAVPRGNFPSAASQKAKAQETLPRPSSRIGLKMGALLAVHVPLALLMQQYPNVGLVHALVVMVVSLWWITAEPRLERAAYASAYIVGAEVMWRMTKTPIFWEFAKYAAIVVFLFALLRNSRFKIPILPVLYFVLLLPSLLLTFSGLGFTESRMQASFNLSGPLAVMIAASYFSQVRLTQEQLHRILLVMLGPICGIVAIALYNTLTTTAIVFINSSNFDTSGGFGPNQVSAILGLGAFVIYIWLLARKLTPGLRVLSIGLLFLLAAMSALTFSRNGVVIAACAALAFSIYFLRDRRARLKFAMLVAMLFCGAYFVILPTLKNFTSGAIISRFEERSTTGRDSMILTDLRVWWDNPLFGVGPGMARPYYDSVLGLGYSIPAHTEFSRMLSEHGMFGLVSLMLLLIMAANNFRRTSDRQTRSVYIGLLVWSFLYMSANAMRLMAPAFIYGITFARVLSASSFKPRTTRTLFDTYWRGERLAAPRSSARS